jgi:hypothetical protein
VMRMKSKSQSEPYVNVGEKHLFLELAPPARIAAALKTCES